MGLISRVSSRTYRKIMNDTEIRNHPYYEMLVGMGFDNSKVVTKIRELQSDNLEDYICALTAEPEPIAAATTQPEQPKSTPTPEKIQTNQNSNADYLENLAKKQAAENEERRRKNLEVEKRAEQARALRIEREKKEKFEKGRLRRSEGQKMMGMRNDFQDVEMQRLQEKRK